MEKRNSKEMNAPLVRDTVGSKQTRLRVMQRKSQGMVAVYEQEPAAPETGARALVFESPVGRACIESYPKDWYRLSDDELVQLRRAAS